MWQTIGHSWAVEQLAASAASGHISRANLFTGHEHIGKFHLALEFAAALNCVGESRPCGTCVHCSRVAASSHPDLTIVQPDSGHVKIGQIRAMQHELSLKPFEARWRVAIITDMQTATEEAENALLKTLEEPPGQAVIILTAVDAGLLEPTVVSRCRVLALQPVPAQIIAQALVDRGLDATVADEIARLSGGQVGWALEAAGSPKMVARHEQIVDQLLALLDQGYASSIAAAETLGRQSDLNEIVSEWQSVWRDVMLISAGCPDLITNRRYQDRLDRLAQRVGLRRAQRAAADTRAAMEQLEQNVNSRLAIEAMLLGWHNMSS
ncbi:MAG: DNA polymerase III subunit [Anaerolineae bacterium]